MTSTASAAEILRSARVLAAAEGMRWADLNGAARVVYMDRARAALEPTPETAFVAIMEDVESVVTLGVFASRERALGVILEDIDITYCYGVGLGEAEATELLIQAAEEFRANDCWFRTVDDEAEGPTWHLHATQITR